MANTVIQLKHSTESGNVPSSLANGEISINNRDGKFFYSTPDGIVLTHYPYLGPSGLNEEVQFNDSGDLGSDSGLTYNKTTDVLTVVGGAIIGGVNVTPQIQLAFTQANSAFIHANAAFNYANTITAGTDQWVRNQANAAFDAANSASIYANGAFAAANSSGVYANGAFSAANSASSYANSAFLAANTADDKATSAGVYANGAFAAANNEAGVNATQNNSITAAFEAANSAGIYANGAFVRANNSINANTGGTITGDLTVTQNLSVGNLFVSGQTFSVNAGTIIANDTLFILGAGNYFSDTKDIGFAGHYNDGTNAHSGLIRDIGTKEWYLFKNYTLEIDANNNVIITDPSFTVDTLNANLKSTTITIKDIDLLPYVNNAYTAANTADDKATSAGVYANGAFAAANNEAGVNATQNNNISAASSYANSAFAVANSASIYANGAFIRANNSINANVGGTITGNTTIVGNLFVTNTTTSVSTTSGALRISGGLGVTGNINADAVYDGGVEVIQFANNAFQKANAASVRTISFVIDGAGSVIAAGQKGNVMVDFNGTIDAWSVLGNASGSITIDVSKASYTNFPTFTASGGTSPALSSQQKNQNVGINWTGFTTVSANDIIRFVVSGTPTTVTLVTVALKITTTV